MHSFFIHFLLLGGHVGEWIGGESDPGSSRIGTGNAVAIMSYHSNFLFSL